MSTKQLWDACRHLRCPGCGAEPGAYCTFTIRGVTLTRRVPCLLRTNASKENA